MSATAMAPELRLPWESSTVEDAKFRSILRNMLVVFAVFALAIPFLPVQELGRVKLEQVPRHLARVILEQKELPKPPVIVSKPKPKLKPKPKVQEKPKPAAKPKPDVNQARKAAQTAGVLAFQDDLMSMRDTLDMDSLNNTQTRRGQENATVTERSIITTGTRGDSGGIKTADLSRDAGGAALSGRETTQISGAVTTDTKRQRTNGRSASMGGRSDESVRRVMDRNKGAIYSIYNRALRGDPLLQGKLVFEMLIDAGGTVTELKLLSSELNDENLSRKILSRIRLIQFGAEDVHPTRVNYSFDFLPFA